MGFPEGTLRLSPFTRPGSREKVSRFFFVGAQMLMPGGPDHPIWGADGFGSLALGVGFAEGRKLASEGLKTASSCLLLWPLVRN